MPAGGETGGEEGEEMAEECGVEAVEIVEEQQPRGRSSAYERFKRVSQRELRARRWRCADAEGLGETVD
jgi:hypothetical protein